MKEWHKEFYGEWLVATEEEARQEEIARVYFSRCDLYDRKVCTGKSPRTGEPMPVTDYERRAVDANAYEVKKELMRLYHLTHKEFQDAIKGYAR